MPIKNAKKRKAYHNKYNREVWYPANKKRRSRLNRASIQKKVDDIKKMKLAAGCTDCGYNAHPDALEYDHLRDKHFSISNAARNQTSWVRILAEMEKCEVVCANCHRIRTATRRTSKNKKTLV